MYNIINEVYAFTGSGILLQSSDEIIKSLNPTYKNTIQNHEYSLNGINKCVSLLCIIFFIIVMYDFICAE